jgi:hypothetical protein
MKCAIVVAEHLQNGLAVNAASVLSVTLGAKVQGLVGGDVKDADGVTHPGVIYTPLPVLTDSADRISQMLTAAADDEELFFATFSSLAQSCKTYDEYIARMSAVATADVEVVGIALFGPKKKVNKLVGSLPLLR